MKRIPLEWHEIATDGLPDSSGWYFTIGRCGTPYYLPYSHRFRLFNARDNESADEAFDSCIECRWWAEMPEKLQKICGEVSHAWLKEEGLA